MELNYSMSISPGATQPTQHIELWSFRGVNVYPASRGVSILHEPSKDVRMLIQNEVASALQHCTQFRSIDQHLETLLKVMPELSQDKSDAENVLRSIAEAGFLEPAATMWRRLTEESSADSGVESEASADSQSAAKLIILTCDRPEALGRLLTQMQAIDLPPSVSQVVIVDDSRSAAAKSENSALVDSHQAHFAIPLFHHDAASQNKLLTHLKQTLPAQSDALDFLLNRDFWEGQPTYGVARNHGLLLSVGYRALLIDDDIEPVCVAPPMSPRSLRFGQARDMEAVFFSSKEAQKAHALEQKDDPFDSMLQKLGATLGETLVKCGAEPRMLQGVEGTLLNHLHSDSTVITSQCGTWGDPGTSANNWVFFHSAESIARLLELGEDPGQTLSARASWIGHRGPVISRFGLKSCVTGVDHRQLLPPYLPAGRGEDALFGIMVERMHPDSVVFEEEWAISHQPIEDRTQDQTLQPARARPAINLLANWLGRGGEPADRSTPSSRLAHIAKALTDLAETHEDHLEALLREELLKSSASLLDQCMQHLASAQNAQEQKGSKAWGSFLERCRADLLQDIQTPAGTPMQDKLAHGDLTIEKLRQWGLGFAAGLAAWPDIREAAADFIEAL